MTLYPYQWVEKSADEARQERIEAKVQQNLTFWAIQAWVRAYPFGQRLAKQLERHEVKVGDLMYPFRIWLSDYQRKRTDPLQYLTEAHRESRGSCRGNKGCPCEPGDRYPRAPYAAYAYMRGHTWTCIGRAMSLRDQTVSQVTYRWLRAAWRRYYKYGGIEVPG